MRRHGRRGVQEPEDRGRRTVVVVVVTSRCRHVVGGNVEDVVVVVGGDDEGRKEGTERFIAFSPAVGPSSIVALESPSALEAPLILRPERFLTRSSFDSFIA